jgi:hypothetical protein
VTVGVLAVVVVDEPVVVDIDVALEDVAADVLVTELPVSVVVIAAVATFDDVEPSYVAPATAPNAATAARLPTADPIVSVRSRATARSRSAGLRRCAFVMSEGSIEPPFRFMTQFFM